MRFEVYAWDWGGFIVDVPGALNRKRWGGGVVGLGLLVCLLDGVLWLDGVAAAANAG